MKAANRHIAKTIQQKVNLNRRPQKRQDFRRLIFNKPQSCTFVHKLKKKKQENVIKQG